MEYLPVVKIKKFLRIRFPHAEKPPEHKILGIKDLGIGLGLSLGLGLGLGLGLSLGLGLGLGLGLSLGLNLGLSLGRDFMSPTGNVTSWHLLNCLVYNIKMFLVQKKY